MRTSITFLCFLLVLAGLASEAVGRRFGSCDGVFIGAWGEDPPWLDCQNPCSAGCGHALVGGCPVGSYGAACGCLTGGGEPFCCHTVICTPENGGNPFPRAAGNCSVIGLCPVGECKLAGIDLGPPLTDYAACWPTDPPE
jgi:hypothetical protein